MCSKTHHLPALCTKGLWPRISDNSSSQAIVKLYSNISKKLPWRRQGIFYMFQQWYCAFHFCHCCVCPYYFISSFRLSFGIFFWFYFQRNTFQAVLASDDNTTFVIFLYDKIQWTYGYELEDIPAQVDTYDIVWLSDLLSWVGGGLDW